MDTSEHCKEVYAYFGLSMYRASSVEQSIIQLIMLYDFFSKHVPNFKSKAQWESDFDKFDCEMSLKTMGRLVKYLVGLEAINSEIEEKLQKVLIKRNWLAHRFFVDHAINFVSSSGRDKMITELQESYELFNEIETILNPITMSLLNKYGLTEEHFEKAKEEIFQEAGCDL